METDDSLSATMPTDSYSAVAPVGLVASTCRIVLMNPRATSSAIRARSSARATPRPRCSGRTPMLAT